ncbi:MAG: hypothetical protein GX289_09375 [Tissierellia bacterium]|mgnify:CR=1 FL=1|nr:hypothetical protein [Tissierellia bacterium]
MNNYRNNMPHYDSLPHYYNPMGINEHKISNDNRLHFTSSSPTMPELHGNMFRRPFIPDTEMPIEIDGDIPALPRMPDTQMPGLTQPGMPGMPGMPMQGLPGLIPPWMPQMPEMQQPGMPMMPGMPQTQMPMMPEMPQTQMPMMPGMPQTGMPTDDGNMYPMMPGMPQPGMPPVTCEQLRELMRRMNCPINSNQDLNNRERPLVPPENGTVPPMDEDM